MTIVLVFVIVYMAASAWDIGHINNLLDTTINPGRRKQSKALEPAPRLVINLPAKPPTQ